ncbi:hypothetical protein [Chitinophaga sp.]|uniref:hypothetical protein n=1 Tax=Chitinophaga sp. TaxID=1869181 RepID=UPI002F943249
MQLEKDYTYFVHSIGIADQTGTFKLGVAEMYDVPNLNLIIFNDADSSDYHFIKDTLVLKPYGHIASVDYAIWETKYIRIAND